MYQELAAYIQTLEDDFFNISDERKQELRQIAAFIKSKRATAIGDPAKLTFICTHNSRRSHLCQIWAATMSEYLRVEQVQSFSGGTEATAFNPRAVKAIQRAGFNVVDPGGKNPRYQIYFDNEKEPLICFSKTFDDLHNPQDDFLAIMTCSDADENCPFVPGASMRISIPYVDPKESDSTAREEETYDERCRQIATEMFYLMSEV